MEVSVQPLDEMECRDAYARASLRSPPGMVVVASPSPLPQQHQHTPKGGELAAFVGASSAGTV